MKKVYPTLYSRTNTNAIQIWFATQNNNEYTTTYGQLDGKLVTTKPIYCEAKNVGKANETSPAAQCEIEIAALYEKRKKQNYF